MMKTVQYFSDEYLASCRNATPEQIIEFVENFRTLHFEIENQKSKSKLISIKVPQNLLQSFKYLCDKHEVAYQTQIKTLMKKWLENF
jgi:predicted DNA binding CopG/RHH family protein